MIERSSPLRPPAALGKALHPGPRGTAIAYKKLPEFKELVMQYDPQGRFRNEFLATTSMAD